MYIKGSSILSNKQDISNYIEGFDVYNSKLISLLSDSSLDRDNYTITTYEYRPDLIAADIYGSTKYLGILLVTQSIGLEGYKKGVILRVIPKRIIDALVNTL